MLIPTPLEIRRNVPAPAEHLEREGFPRSLVLVHRSHHQQCPRSRVQVAFQILMMTIQEHFLHN